jgi:hypothetical protein
MNDAKDGFPMCSPEGQGTTVAKNMDIYSMVVFQIRKAYRRLNRRIFSIGS